MDSLSSPHKHAPPMHTSIHTTSFHRVTAVQSTNAHPLPHRIHPTPTDRYIHAFAAASACQSTTLWRLACTGCSGLGLTSRCCVLSLRSCRSLSLCKSRGRPYIHIPKQPGSNTPIRPNIHASIPPRIHTLIHSYPRTSTRISNSRSCRISLRATLKRANVWVHVRIGCQGDNKLVV